MKVFVAPGRDETGKLQGVALAFWETWEGPVLDVGSRSGSLKHELPNGNMAYCGLDLYAPADVIGNLEIGLPFGNESFKTVVALDVLEHTDNIYRAIKELYRVARANVIIALPNVYEVKGRLKFMLGRKLSGKYGLPLDPPDDRHRWLFSLREARAFTHTMGRHHGFGVISEGCLIGPRRGFAVGRLLVAQFPNLLSPRYIALLQRTRIN